MFVTPERALFLDILPKATIRANGIEKSNVKKKILSVVNEPLSMA